VFNSEQGIEVQAMVNSDLSVTNNATKTVNSGFKFSLLTLIASCVFLLFIFMGLSSGIQERLYQLQYWLNAPLLDDQHVGLSDAIKMESNPCNTEVPSTNTKKTNTQHRTSEEDSDLFDDLLAIEPAESISLTSPCSPPKDAVESINHTQQASFNLLESITDILQLSSIWLSGHQAEMLAIFIAIALVSATHLNKHISIRTHQANTFVLIIQTITSLIVIHALVSYIYILWQRHLSLYDALPYVFLLSGFLTNLVILFNQIFRTASSSSKAHSFTLKGLLFQTPLYCWMILIPTIFSTERTSVQLSLLIGNMFELPQIYLQIALYIWLGLLLQKSLLIHQLIHRVLTLPLNNAGLILTLVALMAFPTALTGASGILILAFGALIYAALSQRLMRKQLALAITALTGSTGVVLTPSLLVVAIAFMNRSVTTTELFFWGGLVFLTTLGVLCLVLLWINRYFPDTGLRQHTSINPPEQAPTLLIYFSVISTIILFAYGLLGLSFNEFTAPYLLIILIVSILWFEKIYAKNIARKTELFDASAAQSTHQTLPHKLYDALHESIPHSGAILMIMLGSFTLASTSFEPNALNFQWINEITDLSKLLLLLCILVIIGMILEPFGALALVSLTLAPLAYEYGLNPIHFWMITIVAFELGYVTPPVAINHLLTNQQLPEGVIDQANNQAKQSSKGRPAFQSFYLQHERLLVPIIVMAITLLIVTFAPLIWQRFFDI
jgi:TRAP-type C4-dicarboxylate transport system permease large subunit